MKRMVGEKIFDAYYPDRYYNHDAEDPDGMVELGAHRRTARWSTINRRAAESDLLIYVNINLVPMDGGHKSVGIGLATTSRCGRTTSRRPSATSDSYMEPKRERAAPEHRAHRSGDRQAPEGLPHRDRAEQPDVRRSDWRSSARTRRTSPSSTG